MGIPHVSKITIILPSLEPTKPLQSTLSFSIFRISHDTWGYPLVIALLYPNQNLEKSTLERNC